MSRRIPSIIGLSLVLAVLVSLAIAPTASAHGGGRHHLPARIDLPDGFQPEGIASDRHQRLYVGSLADGAVLKVDPRSGRVRTLVAGVTGTQALGLKVDWKGRLWVAGGGGKEVRVYSSRSGRLLETYAFPSAGFLNDLVVTRKAVYVTDSINQQLAVIPLGRHGRLKDPARASVSPLTGDIAYQDGFNANGIVWKGGWLVIVQTNTGKLFRTDPKTGLTKEIDLRGLDVANGDGLLIRGKWLWVVRNLDNKVDVYRLGARLLSARFAGAITRTGPDRVDVPTTAAFALDKLWAVNARFTTPPTPTTEYWITRLPVRP
jgi:sugar lactone lactonase YvrE